MASSPENHKSLKSLTVTVGDTEWANITFPNTTDVYVYLDSIKFWMNEEAGYEEKVISATVTDVDGESATTSITICNIIIENPEPSIDVIESYGYVVDGDTVNPGQTIRFGFTMASNAETQKELKSLVVMGDESELANIELHGTSYTYTDSLVFEFASGRQIIGQVVITAIVADVDGKTASASITLNLNYEDHELVVTDFTWNRHGSAAATGLAEYGLEWTFNAKDEIFAQIKPMEGYTLYEIPAEIWASVTTEGEKDALFLALAEFPSIAIFNKVSVVASHDNLDYVIGTINQGTGESQILSQKVCLSAEAKKKGLANQSNPLKSVSLGCPNSK